MWTNDGFWLPLDLDQVPEEALAEIDARYLDTGNRLVNLERTVAIPHSIPVDFNPTEVDAVMYTFGVRTERYSAFRRYDMGWVVSIWVEYYGESPTRRARPGPAQPLGKLREMECQLGLLNSTATTWTR